MPENTVYVGRGSRYGNQFKVEKLNGRYRIKNCLNGEYSQSVFKAEKQATKRACDLFVFFLHRKYRGAALDEFLAPLRGKDLACWCNLEKQCHADALLRLTNKK